MSKLLKKGTSILELVPFVLILALLLDGVLQYLTCVVWLVICALASLDRSEPLTPCAISAAGIVESMIEITDGRKSGLLISVYAFLAIGALWSKANPRTKLLALLPPLLLLITLASGKS